MSAGHWQNLVAMFLEQADQHGEAPFLWAKRDGAYQPLSWRRTADMVARAAGMLRAQGVGSGDRIVVVSENRPEWLIADLAIMTAGAITVPAFTTSTTQNFLYLVQHSQAKGAIISTARLAHAFLPAAHQAGTLDFVITMEDLRLEQDIHVRIVDWHNAMAEQESDWGHLRAAAQTLARDDLACLIYTSGTKGAPKGVMTHHGGILHNCIGARDVLEEIGSEGHRFLSFLPMSHAYEHSGGQMFPIATGSQIYYAEGIDKLMANMLEARPTLMVVVPRLFELMRQRILRHMEKESRLKRMLFERTVALGIRRYRNGGRLGPVEGLENRLLDRLVRAGVRGRFGGRLKMLVSGGAPLNIDVAEFFAGLGVPLVQGYGQTEASPVVSVNRPSHIRMDTVGPPMRGVTVKIAADGEILVKGELVMKGYWRDEAATAEALVDGWLHTGDVGHIDADGHLVITDRKKDIIVNDKGENISPQRVEGMLAIEPEIAQAIIHGNNKPYIVCLLVPDAEWLAEWTRREGKSADLASLRDDRGLYAALDAAVDRVNKHLDVHERVRRFRIASTPFTIENDQMTPTMKLRRHVIYDRYAADIDALYEEGALRRSGGR